MQHLIYRLHTLSVYLGNTLEHYDKALYGVLAPFLAPIFFPDQDPVFALMLIYLVYPLAMIARPVGAVFFGYIGDTRGREEALSISLIGVAIATLSIAFIPTGVPASPLLLLLARALQNFFSAGEVAGGAIYLIEREAQTERRPWVNSLFGASTIIGFLAASGATALLCAFDAIEQHWRTLYLVGGLTGLFGAIVRASKAKVKEMPKHDWKKDLLRHKGLCLVLIVSSGFSYANYMVALVLTNGFVPLVADVSREQMIELNTALLGLDLVLLPFFGWVACQFSAFHLLVGATVATAILGVPLFTAFEGANFWLVAVVRGLMVCIGVAFSASYYAWAVQQVPHRLRYTLISVSYALGSQMLGGPTAAIAMWAYKHTQWAGSAAVYWAALGVATMVGILYQSKVSEQQRDRNQLRLAVDV